MGSQRAADDGAAGRGGARMRIGIDCRKIADFGIGTYIRGLLHALVELGGDEYVALGGAGIAPLLPPGAEHIIVDAPHYSIRELLILGRAADRARLDLFHAPHYVVPMLQTPFVVTIHDLIHLRHRNPLARLYARTMIGRAVRKSRRVLTVSESVRSELAAFGHPEKIIVTPNGVDALFFDAQAALPGPHHNYFLFVGNDKPHKNVERVANYGMEDGKLIDFVSRTTPTAGAESTFLKGMFINLLHF